MQSTDATTSLELQYDGVICFGGEDWWYHNRGHYDMQIMRRFAQRVPVLYLNSLGMRVPRPKEGRMFFTRVRRKFRSFQRGLVEVESGFHVLSPPAIPSPAGLNLTRSMLLRAIRSAARRIGITRPLIWIACPTAAAVVDGLQRRDRGFPASARMPLIYQRTDRYESFAGVDRERISSFDLVLKMRADCTIFCSPPLFEDERAQCHHAALIEHGVDYDHFSRAADDPVPADLAALPRPRVGFIGGIDRHTFDPDLFRSVAARLPQLNFALIGACSLPDGWCRLLNVTQFGQRPYEEVARYMAGCDVLIMPWNCSSWIEACNPVKLREYLATGRPIVSTPIPALKRWRSHVQVASDADAFAIAIESALADPGNGRSRQMSVQHHTWDARAAEVKSMLKELGISDDDDTIAIAREHRERICQDRSVKRLIGSEAVQCGDLVIG